MVHTHHTHTHTHTHTQVRDKAVDELKSLPTGNFTIIFESEGLDMRE